VLLRQYLYFCASIHLARPQRGEDAPGRRASVSICTFVLVKQVNFGFNASFLARPERGEEGPALTFCVSICTFVLVKQVLRTSKASETLALLDPASASVFVLLH
jgi:hypothetical protein